MSESTGGAPVRDAVEHFLRQGFGTAEVDADGDFVVHREGTVTWVRTVAVDDEHTAVVIFSPAAVGVRVDGDLTRFLATEDLGLDFAHFELHDRATPMAVVSHSLLGEYLSREELTTAVDEVSSTAGRYGPQITERFGGWVPGPVLDRGLGDALGALAGQSATPSTSRRPAPQTAVRAGGNLMTLASALGAALLARGWSSSWWLAAFVFLMVVFVGSALRDVVVRPPQWHRGALLALVPTIAVAVLALGYWLWDRWWLAVVLGLVLGVLGAAVLGAALFPDVAEELEGTKEPDRRSYLTGELP